MINYFLLALFVGLSAHYLHLLIGAPVGVRKTNHVHHFTSQYHAGMLLSQVGRWATERYDRYEAAHFGRPHRINPYTVLCCKLCFGTWVSAVSWAILLSIAMPQPLSWVLYPYLVASSTILAHLIK